jgi:hypothetical protein
MNEAIKFIMEFYSVTHSDAVKYYWDEIESYMQLLSWKNTTNDK